MDNGLCESFNGRLRDECLNTHEFESLEQAKRIIEAWRRDYNDHRPHGSLGKLTPSNTLNPTRSECQKWPDSSFESQQNWGRKLPRLRDKQEVELSCRILAGGSNEEIAIYGKPDCWDSKGSR